MISMGIISEGILTFRTWAVWRLDKNKGIIMGTVFILIIATGIVFATLSMLGLECTSSPSRSTKAYFTYVQLLRLIVSPPPFTPFQGCFITGGNSFMLGCWICIFLYDAWMVIWLSVQAMRTCEHVYSLCRLQLYCSSFFSNIFPTQC
jgi:hypothetical protein